MNNQEYFYQVVITGYALDSLTYKSSINLNLGRCVIVKLRGQKKVGYITQKLSPEQIKLITFKTLSIESALDEKYSLTKTQLEISNWMVKYYLNPTGLNFELFIPRALKIKDDKIDYAPIKKKFIKCVDTEVSKEHKYYDDYKKLLEIGTIKYADISSIGISQSRVKTLIKNGVAESIILTQDREIRLPNNRHNSNIHPLNDEQQVAYDIIRQSYNTYSPFLLFGITGSGKTNIYQHIAKDLVKEQGGSVLILVPEIGLTPQLFSKFYSIFSSRVVYYNSQLNPSERHEIWLGVKQGDYKVVVGTRSALFLPFVNLRCIIIDEEHDSSFTQTNAPFYNSNDIASMICKTNNIPLVLGTATPSLQTYYKAKQNKLTTLKLVKRATSVKPPELRFIDMQKEKQVAPLLSEFLLSEIRKTIQSGKKVILYFNRRGYNTMSICDSCNSLCECPHCSTSVVYHFNEKVYKCHVCGYTVSQLNHCECGGSFAHSGIGNQQVEECLQELFSDVDIVRMDRDSVAGKDGHEKVLNKFISSKRAILIGTQMITKGHNIQGVGLVGVLIADMGLSYPDYRNEEKVFQQLLQVVGRTGRENEQGKAIIQTYNIDNPIYRYVKTANFDVFADYQFKLREKYGYPPFCNISRVTLISKNEQLLTQEAENLVNLIKSRFLEVECVGAFQPMLYKMKDEFFLAILLKHQSVLTLNHTLRQLKEIFIEKNGIKVYYKLSAEDDTI